MNGGRVVGDYCIALRCIVLGALAAVLEDVVSLSPIIHQVDVAVEKANNVLGSSEG